MLAGAPRLFPMDLVWSFTYRHVPPVTVENTFEVRSIICIIKMEFDCYEKTTFCKYRKYRIQKSLKYAV